MDVTTPGGHLHGLGAEIARRNTGPFAMAENRLVVPERSPDAVAWVATAAADAAARLGVRDRATVKVEFLVEAPGEAPVGAVNPPV